MDDTFSTIIVVLFHLPQTTSKNMDRLLLLLQRLPQSSLCFQLDSMLNKIDERSPRALVTISLKAHLLV